MQWIGMIRVAFLSEDLAMAPELELIFGETFAGFVGCVVQEELSDFRMNNCYSSFLSFHRYHPSE